MSEQIVPLCRNDTTLCDSSAWEITLGFTNFFAVLLNLFHLLLLFKMNSFRGTAYFHILVNMGVADLLYGIFYGLWALCWIRELATRSRGFSAFISMMDLSFLMKYILMVYSTMERVIALKYPLKYTNSFMIKKMNVLMIGSWFIVITVNVTNDLYYYDMICINDEFGPTPQSRVGIVFIILMTYLPILLIIIALILIGVELHKRSKKRLMPAEERLVVAAAKYITVISVMFLCFLVPIIVAESAQLNFVATYGKLCNALYGILNTLIFFIMSKAYRNELLELFSCKRENSVANEI